MNPNLRVFLMSLASLPFFQISVSANDADFTESLQAVKTATIVPFAAVKLKSHGNSPWPIPANYQVRAVTEKLRIIEEQGHRAVATLESFPSLLSMAYDNDSEDRRSDAKQNLRIALNEGIRDTGGYSSSVNEATRDLRAVSGAVNDADAHALFIQAAAVSAAGARLSTACRNASSNLNRYPKTIGNARAFDIYADRLLEGTPELMRLANSIVNGNRGRN